MTQTAHLAAQRQKIVGFGNDGASVMTSKTNGEARPEESDSIPNQHSLHGPQTGIMFQLGCK